MKTCLIRPPSIVNPVSYIASLTPPIGVTYLAASLREAGHEVVLIDGVGEKIKQEIPIAENLLLRGLSFQEIVERIPHDSEIIGISVMFSSEWPQIRSLINQIGDAFEKSFFVGGGEHFTAATYLSLEQCPGLDACVMGEGDEVIVELTNALEKGESLKKVKGLVFKSGNEICKTAPHPRKRKIDDIPHPAWDMVPINNYLDNLISYGVYRGRSMPLLASRGCPYQCTFCSNHLMWTSLWLARDYKKVVDEIEEYIEKYQASNFDFYDLTAIVNRRWIINFCKELLERNIKITWQLPGGTRSEAIDREVSKLLYQSGCRNMNYAPESGSERMLSLIKKKLKLSTLAESLKGAVAEGLNVKLNIIIGFPDETHKDIWKTLWLLVKLSWHGAHDVAAGVFAPYPGSELYERLVREGKITHSNEYFEKLVYVDITKTVSYCNNVSSKWLKIYIWLAFALFYGTNYLFRPQRFIRTIRNLIKNEHESRGEMALADLLGRFKKMNKKNGSFTAN